ncbi:activating signal cointegrator 1 complex subunit 1 [Colletes gigas]|uniref:activating signal cointegrator 1 complex subunit 1 n=1 Tax=Colletes gigas TaxID=935657 RepID=UPI001C9ADFFA|nr:activating signal cointegrator 1 complex subunit 1 [Colletes gigas]
MNILKPELIWVDDRCYRCLRNKECDKHDIDPYIEYDYDLNLDLDKDCQEEYDNIVEIEPHEETRFKHTFHVAKQFFPFIIGCKNAVRKKLETETRTVIQIPRIGQDGGIVIIGSNCKGIIKARHRINLLIESARSRLGFTHFLSIPLNEGQIIMKFNMFKNDIMNMEKVPRGVDEMVFQKPSKLHLTIGMITLPDDVKRDKAIEALNYCEDHIIKPKIKQHGQIRIYMQGTDIMNDDPTEVNILFAKIIDKDNALQEIVDEIRNHYFSIGLLRKENEKAKLHVTLMNSAFRIDKEAGYVRRQQFDAQEILKVHENTFFGETTLKQIHISQLHTIGNNGYYQATAKIDFLEDL